MNDTSLRKTFIRVLAFVFAFLLCSCLSSDASFEMQSCSTESNNQDFSVQQEQFELFPIVEDNNWGFIDVDGRIAINPQFKEVSRFHEGLAAFKSIEDGRWGYINSKGEIVIEPVFDAAFPFYEGRAVVTVDGRQGFIDEKGAFIHRPLYTTVTRFSQGRAFVLIGGSWKLINQNGDYVIENSFRQVNIFREGLASFAGFNTDYEKSGYLNRDGEIEILLEDEFYVDIENVGFLHGRAPIFKLRSLYFRNIFSSSNTRTRVYGLINKSGKLVFSPRYDFIDIGSECTATISTRNRYGAIDLDGNIIIPPRYSHLEEFSEGLALAQRRKGEKYGYINRQGKFAIKPIQEINNFVLGDSDSRLDINRAVELPSFRNFYAGRAVYKGSNGKYGYIDMFGNVVIEPNFDLAFPFRDGNLAKFENLDEWGYINVSGAIVWRSEKMQMKAE